MSIGDLLADIEVLFDLDIVNKTAMYLYEEDEEPLKFTKAPKIRNW